LASLLTEISAGLWGSKPTTSPYHGKNAYESTNTGVYVSFVVSVDFSKRRNPSIGRKILLHDTHGALLPLTDIVGYYSQLLTTVLSPSHRKPAVVTSKSVIITSSNSNIYHTNAVNVCMSVSVRHFSFGFCHSFFSCIFQLFSSFMLALFSRFYFILHCVRFSTGISRTGKFECPRFLAVGFASSLKVSQSIPTVTVMRILGLKC